MNPASTIFVLGYHGFDHEVAERVLEARQPIQRSHNDYDWLSDGAYFWEHNPHLAFEFACELHIQICVRNVACIKGYFRPLDEAGKPLVFK